MGPDQNIIPAAAMAPPVITLGPQPVTLVEPPSLFALACARSEAQIDLGGLAETLSYGAAALRMCWPADKAWPVRVRPMEWRPGLAVTAYGAAIWEDLRAGTKGTHSISILRAAVLAAHNFAVFSALTEAEVREAQGFSTGQEA